MESGAECHQINIDIPLKSGPKTLPWGIAADHFLECSFSQIIFSLVQQVTISAKAFYLGNNTFVTSSVEGTCSIQSNGQGFLVSIKVFVPIRWLDGATDRMLISFDPKPDCLLLTRWLLLKMNLSICLPEYFS